MDNSDERRTVVASDVLRSMKTGQRNGFLLGVLRGVVLAATLLALPGRALGGEALIPSDEKPLAIATAFVDRYAADKGD